MIIACLAGKMSLHRIRVLDGDKVKVIIDNYGEKGRIVQRLYPPGVFLVFNYTLFVCGLRRQLKKYVQSARQSGARAIFMLPVRLISAISNGKVKNHAYFGCHITG